MLTPLTQTALAVLNDISCGEASPRNKQCAFSPNTLADVLSKLELYGLIRLLPGKSRENILSYELTCPPDKITLLNVLEAIGEHLNCNHEVYEEMYYRYGIAARKLGVINRMTRLYLAEIKLTDL